MACKKLDKLTYTDAQVIKLAAQVVPLKVDAEKEGKQLGQQYKIKAYPTILFLDAAGEIQGRIFGFLPAVQFAHEMAKIDACWRARPQVEAALKARPDDGEANAKMAAIHAVRQQLKEAEDALARAEKAQYTGDALARAYSALGDLQLGKEEADEALRLFQKADTAAKIVGDRAYAKYMLMTCYQAKQDAANAKKFAKELVDLTDAPAEIVSAAKEVLK